MHRAAGFDDAECARFARYISRDVRVHLPAPEPAWLTTAMDHRCDMTYSELLESMGAREGAYLLLCGEVGAPSPHRALVEPITGGAAAPKSEASEVSSWAEYYAARELSPDTPLPLLLTFPLTLYHLLMDHPARAAKATTGDEPLRVHVLGPEKEAFLLPLFGELSALLPRSRLEISMIGPVAFDLPTWPSVSRSAAAASSSLAATPCFAS